jgi:hypothetical protein
MLVEYFQSHLCMFIRNHSFCCLLYVVSNEDCFSVMYFMNFNVTVSRWTTCGHLKLMCCTEFLLLNYGCWISSCYLFCIGCEFLAAYFTHHVVVVWIQCKVSLSSCKLFGDFMLPVSIRVSCLQRIMSCMLRIFKSGFR